jgi:hypothetical protein
MDGQWSGTSGRKLTNAEMTVDNENMKTIRFEWNNGRYLTEHTFYRALRVEKIRYIKYLANICEFTNCRTYAIYGDSAWHQIRKEAYSRGVGQSSNPHHRLVDRMYPSYPNPLTEPGWNLDWSCLSYRGYAIIGSYDNGSGIGWAKILPYEAVNHIKLLQNGFEQFLYWKTAKAECDAYYFVNKGGREGVIGYGKKIVDWIKGGTVPLGSTQNILHRDDFRIIGGRARPGGVFDEITVCDGARLPFTASGRCVRTVTHSSNLLILPPGVHISQYVKPKGNALIVIQR